MKKRDRDMDSGFRGGRAARIAFYGLFTALAMTLSYLETLLPPLGVPGAKIGLSNIVTVTGLYTIGAPGTAAVSVLRIILTGLSFGNPSMMIYSFSGWALSMAAMIFLKRTGAFSAVGVSVFGGVMHNLGQLICASLVLNSSSVFVYFPALIAAGIFAGIVTGIAGGILAKRLSGYFNGNMRDIKRRQKGI